MKNKTEALRNYIVWAIECYNVACTPPAINYSKHIDPISRDDVNSYSRIHLLRLSIDVKYALNDLLNKIPKNRATVLIGWIAKDEEHYWHNLTYKQQFFLKIDRKSLINRLK